MKNVNGANTVNDFQTEFAQSNSTESAESAESVGDLTIGVVIDISSTGAPLIDYPGNASDNPVHALATVDINKASIGRQVAILFAAGDLNQPVVIGLIRNIVDHSADSEQHKSTNSRDDAENFNSIDTEMDEDNLVFSAKNQVTFKCGKASITLTKAGKVIISGEYVISKSTGVNSLKGGSIQLN